MSLEFSAPPPMMSGADGLSPAQKQATALRQAFEKVLTTQKKKLPEVGGNMLIHVPKVATWTIVTSGPRTGLHANAGDDEVHFAMSCADDTLLRLFADDPDLDVENLIERKKLQLEGDVSVFTRFVALMS